MKKNKRSGKKSRRKLDAEERKRQIVVVKDGKFQRGSHDVDLGCQVGADVAEWANDDRKRLIWFQSVVGRHFNLTAICLAVDSRKGEEAIVVNVVTGRG